MKSLLKCICGKEVGIGNIPRTQDEDTLCEECIKFYEGLDAWLEAYQEYFDAR